MADVLTRLVVDCSVVVKWKIPTEDHAAAAMQQGSLAGVERDEAGEESESARGEKQGVAAAIDAALDEAVSTFAPRLYTPRRTTLIVEVPHAATGNLVTKLETLQQLYPELTIAEMQTLAESRERFLVLEPGQFARLGVAAGDLLGVPGGETRASRAARIRGGLRRPPREARGPNAPGVDPRRTSRRGRLALRTAQSPCQYCRP